jgi:hypothetical protein
LQAYFKQAPVFFPVLCKKTERTGQEKAEKYGTGAMQEEESHRITQKHDIPARRNTGKERPAHAQKIFSWQEESHLFPHSPFQKYPIFTAHRFFKAAPCYLPGEAWTLA